MEFRILGPLEVVEQGRALPLGGARQRALLALLLTRANEVVSADRLIDELWGARAAAGQRPTRSSTTSHSSARRSLRTTRSSRRSRAT